MAQAAGCAGGVRQRGAGAGSKPDPDPSPARQHGDGPERHRRDGGPDVAVSVRMQPPSADITRIAAARDGEKWWFDLPADVPGQYTLWVDAEDLAGNVSTAGPFTVDVACTDAAPVATSLTVEPLRVGPLTDPDRGDLQHRPGAAAGWDSRRPLRGRHLHRTGDDHRPVGSRRVAGVQPPLGAGRRQGLRNRGGANCQSVPRPTVRHARDGALHRAAARPGALLRLEPDLAAGGPEQHRRAGGAAGDRRRLRRHPGLRRRPAGLLPGASPGEHAADGRCAARLLDSDDPAPGRR